MIKHIVGIIILSTVFYCTALKENENKKQKLIQNIIHQVYNISSKALESEDPNEKTEVLKKIENRVKEYSLGFGDKAKKYVHVVMHGLKALIKKHENSLKIERSNQNEIIKAKKVAVNEIVDKILTIAKKHMKYAQTINDKNSVREKFRKTVLDIAAKYNSSKENGSMIFASLITRGLEQMMKKLDQSKRRTEQNEETNNLDDSILKHVNFVKQDEDLYKDTTTLSDTSMMTSTPFKSCTATIIETCDDIKALQRYHCTGNIIPISKLCDGVVDCPNRADEENCLHQATSRMKSINDIMSHLETYILEKCYVSSDNTVLIKQKEVLENVIHTQRLRLGKFDGLNTTEKTKEMKHIKATTSGVASVLETLAAALDGSLCMNDIPDRTKMDAQRQLEVVDDDVISRKEPLKDCNCKEAFCADSSCPESCKLICWYKYSLARWTCHAVDETTSISLNRLCDGKLDCYDESNETGCNFGAAINKFESNEIYDKVLKMIELKSKSKEYASLRDKLTLFYNSVKLLQKTALTKNVSASSVQVARDQCFTSLLSIYEDIIKKSRFVGDLDEAQLFLQSINEKLVSALKRSHVGNEMRIPRDGCFCRNNKCSLPNCPKNCQIACIVRPHFTKYRCKSSESNISIPIEWICNNRIDCPFEDDEANCKADICRKHHFVLLRKTIRDIGEDQKGTALGEILMTLRKKLNSTLVEAEKVYRPTPITFRDIIADILNDLVMTYAAIKPTNDYRRSNNETYFKNFLKISQKIIVHVKQCDK